MLIKDLGPVTRLYQADAGKGGFLEQGLGHLYGLVHLLVLGIAKVEAFYGGILAVLHVPYT